MGQYEKCLLSVEGRVYRTVELTATGDFLPPARSSVANCSRGEPCFLSTLG